MRKKYQKALFIFRRDLRLEDNTTLLEALKASEVVIPAFIFTPDQIENNPFKGLRSLQFMIESLEDLDEHLKDKGSKLYLFYGHPEEILKTLIEKENIDLCAINQDVTPYSKQRDLKLQKTASSHGIDFISHPDAFLHLPEDCTKADGKPYTIFTPFYKAASKIHVREPEKNSYKNYYHKDISGDQGPKIFEKILPQRQKQQKGGRKEALKILHKIHEFENYAIVRDIPHEDASTHLSPHLKFTTISPREAFYTIDKNLGSDHALARSLYWRDFFSLIADQFPYVFKGAFHAKFDQLKWENNRTYFEKWCAGKTGIPIVDAGMRELNLTGYMHNRLRMIVGSFLVKDLHIDWRWGEKYFATHLIDYDPAVNNGNWQWVASTGCDAQPYFRIFNPWRQAERFDPDCLYIKKFVPELKNVPPKIIQNWDKEENWIFCPDYSRPIVDHRIESAKTLKQFKAL